MTGPSGLAASGDGAVAVMYIHAAIGNIREKDMYGYAAHGSMAHAATDGIEGTGVNMLAGGSLQ